MSGRLRRWWAATGNGTAAQGWATMWAVAYGLALLLFAVLAVVSIMGMNLVGGSVWCGLAVLAAWLMRLQIMEALGRNG